MTEWELIAVLESRGMRSKPRKLTIGCLQQLRSGNRYISVPALKLTGLWLDKIGFRTGKQVMVTEIPDGIVVRLVSRPPNAASPQRELF